MSIDSYKQSIESLKDQIDREKQAISRIKEKIEDQRDKKRERAEYYKYNIANASRDLKRNYRDRKVREWESLANKITGYKREIDSHKSRISNCRE